MAQGLCMFDEDGRVTLFNRRYATMMEFSGSSLKGRHLLDLFKEREAKGALSFNPERMYESILFNIRAGMSTTAIVEWSGYVFRNMYQPKQGGGWVATYEDVTEWHKSEKQRNIAFSSIDACPVAITIADPTQPGFPLIYANRKYAQISGYEIGDLIGRPAFCLAGAATDWNSIEEFRRAIETQQRGEARFTFYRKDGTEFLDHVVVVPVLDDTGGVIARIGFHTDVTHDAHHQAEAQRQKMEALGRMVGGVAHEINNMLQPIMLLGRDIIDHGEAGNEEKQQLEIMLDCSGKARKIIGDLLAFSRPPTNTLDVRDPVALLNDGLSLIRKAIPQDIVLTTRIGECQREISVDPTAFIQVLLNLATNATAAMDGRGELTIVLDAEQHGTDATDSPKTMGFVRLRVSDTGCGMTEEALDRAFEPFFTTKPVGQGTGLGLSVVYGLIREMGGTIALDSEVGRGTTVTILIPEHKEETSDGVHLDSRRHSGRAAVPEDCAAG
jgi:PAS domain S-box-containing protein